MPKYRITKNWILEAEDSIAVRNKFIEAVQRGEEDLYFDGIFVREVPESKPKPQGWREGLKRQLTGKTDK